MRTRQLASAIRFLSALLPVILAAASARADGIAAYLDASGWHPLPAREERVFATLDHGVEHLLVQIDVDEALEERHATKIAWVVPIPAPKGLVRAELLQGLPLFSGTQPSHYVRSTFQGLLEIMAASQLWTVPALMVRFWTGALESGGDRPALALGAREGIELEVLSAGSIGSLADQLRERGIEPESRAFMALEVYATIDQAFVLYRIGDYASYRKLSGWLAGDGTSLGIQASFSAKQGYFPLVPGSALLNVEVTTLGLSQAVAPVAPGLSTEYYVGKYDATAEVRRACNLDLSSEAEPYTRFRFDGSARAATTDLHFQPGAPPTVTTAVNWVRRPFHAALEGMLALVAFVGLCLVAFFAARPIWPKATRPSRGRSAVMAAANLLTLAGPLLLAARHAHRHGVPTRTALGYVMTASTILTSLLVLLYLATQHG